jgi:Lon protease-like protein
MSTFDELSFSFEDFGGKVRLFPLPNLVLFPYVMQPLHIFEPRYRDLLEDALAGDHLIAMAVLAPGWERNYEGRPAIHPIACLGRITACCRLPDGTYNVLLLGLRRVKVVREVTSVRRFREAEVEVREDIYPAQQASRRALLQQSLRDGLMRLLPTLPEATEQLDQLLDNDIPLGMLSDLIGYMLDIGLAEKQVLLAEPNVHRRAELLLRHLSVAAADLEPVASAALCFPPYFSTN